MTEIGRNDPRLDLKRVHDDLKFANRSAKVNRKQITVTVVRYFKHRDESGKDRIVRFVE
jgi:hypothetical protein